MGDKTTIEWTDSTWNPVRGCSRVSEGCRFCYAERVAARFSGPGQPYEGLAENATAGPRWTGGVRLVPERLDDPLRWKRPRRIFVNSMSDLFHEELSFEEIAAVYGVMAAAPRHVFQVLTKRPERMLEWATSDGIAGQVDLFKHVALAGRIEEFFAPERKVAIDGWPGYWVTSKGRILTDRGAPSCLWCGGDLAEFSARRKFCSDKCRQRADYEERCGRWSPPENTERELRPMAGEQGHSRVMLYRGEETWRPLIHRLVLGAFDDSVTTNAEVDILQGCHIDGDATNNALWNLRWGTQQDNWEDRKRHGNGGPCAPPAWPLPNVWEGVSVEDQKTAEERIPLLLQTLAAVRWVSAEPLLGAIRFDAMHWPNAAGIVNEDSLSVLPLLDWIVCGGESGPGARPMHPAWARSVRDQCVAAGVAFHFKQWGAWARWEPGMPAAGVRHVSAADGKWSANPGYVDDPAAFKGYETRSDTVPLARVGKRAAGRLLDGRTWDELPEVRRDA